MSTTKALAAAVLAGAAGIALVAVPAAASAAPAVADPTTCTQDGTGTGGAQAYRGGRSATVASPGAAAGTQARGRSAASSTAPRTGTATVVIGSLTAAQKADLAGMAEEEKLAHDLYTALAAKYPSLVQFSRIATSESQHQAALRTLMTRYGVADPTAGQPAGVFVSDDLQALYDSLLAGATSPSAALAAGVAVEKADIADLTSALSGLTASDVTRVYTNLRNGSQQHLVAFGG